MIKVKVDVLDYQRKDFTGKDGKLVNYAYAIVRLGGSLVKITSRADLSSLVGKDQQDINLEVYAGREMKAGVRIV
ncbi:MAG: hypothetical protein A2W22_00490 [Candidatus Levybacteria bacterium RBG_16_35_11]|nr:MAG: hypothetical protein A2W22_00490 [Candidatus Levybacteria bacterium RBG_16_35_11]